jgi:hypothetical protein
LVSGVSDFGKPGIRESGKSGNLGIREIRKFRRSGNPEKKKVQETCPEKRQTPSPPSNA